MGAACESVCSRDMAVNQIQPDTQVMKLRISPKSDGPKESPTQSTIYDIDSDIISSQDEENLEDYIFTEFIQAIKHGNDAMVTFYLEEYPSMNLFNIKDKNNDTVLQTAIRYKRHNLTEQILKEATSINEQNSETGDTALHMAVRLDDIIAVKLLLNCKPDLSITNYDDETALSIAHENQFNDITNILISEMDPKESVQEMTVNTNFVPLKPGNDSKSSKIGHGRISTVKLITLTNDVLQDSQHIYSPNNALQISRLSTNELNGIANDVYNDMCDSVRYNKEHLVVLKAWLHHKQSSPPYSWLKRWVVVKDGYLLWSDRQMSIEDSVTKEEKRRWNKCIHLRKIKDVSYVKSKKQRKFKLTIKKRDYIWRAKTQEQRDQWMDGIKKHMANVKLESVCNHSD